MDILPATLGPCMRSLDFHRPPARLQLHSMKSASRPSILRRTWMRSRGYRSIAEGSLGESDSVDTPPPLVRRPSMLEKLSPKLSPSLSPSKLSPVVGKLRRTSTILGLGGGDSSSPKKKATTADFARAQQARQRRRSTLAAAGKLAINDPAAKYAVAKA